MPRSKWMGGTCRAASSEVQMSCDSWGPPIQSLCKQHPRTRPPSSGTPSLSHHQVRRTHPSPNPTQQGRSGGGALGKIGQEPKTARQMHIPSGAAASHLTKPLAWTQNPRAQPSSLESKVRPLRVNEEHYIFSAHTRWE